MALLVSFCSCLCGERRGAVRPPVQGMRRVGMQYGLPSMMLSKQQSVCELHEPHAEAGCKKKVAMMVVKTPFEPLHFWTVGATQVSAT